MRQRARVIIEVDRGRPFDNIEVDRGRLKDGRVLRVSREGGNAAGGDCREEAMDPGLEKD
jgi:hypothetical protein